MRATTMYSHSNTVKSLKGGFCLTLEIQSATKRENQSMYHRCWLKPTLALVGTLTSREHFPALSATP